MFFLLFFIVSSQHEHRNRLSICNKLSYAIGGAPYQITGCALGFFLQIYLLDVAQVSWLRLFENPTITPVQIFSVTFVTQS